MKVATLLISDSLLGQQIVHVTITLNETVEIRYLYELKQLT